MKKILLIVTGSVAAYKTIDLVRELEEKGYELSMILTASAKHFVTPLTYLSLSRVKIYDDEVFGNDILVEAMLHIELAKNHDLIIISPATADFIAKMSIGCGDSLALCTLLAYQGKLLIAPAMNPNMLSHPATQYNLHLLKERGVEVAEPIYGVTACKDIGYGKYIGNDQILELAHRMLHTERRLSGVKVTITLGATREMIDPVRFIGNTSSGEQGALIAQKFADLGAEVTIIAGYTTFPLPLSCRIIYAYSADEMLKQSLECLPTEVFIGCAAVCDFKPLIYSENKLKKQNDSNLSIELQPNPDIIASIAQQPITRRPRLVVAFALESNNHLANAQQKLKNKAVDLLVLNHTAFMGEAFNDYTLLERNGITTLGKMKKSELAEHLITSVIEKLLSAGEA